ncbi:MAG: universal stress protein [Candidatus Thermoplasmatota archaeon]|nr:universal stress protein [Candidatus Thermoplasmatota archaeon]
MNEPSARLRIWVALDESPRSAAALTAAAALAAELDAELAGLFVEDISLQHLIGLPFAREFSVLSGELRPLSLGEMERVWRREAATLKRQLAEAAERLRLRWSFRVARGRVLAEVSTQAQAFDLVVLGKRIGIRVMTLTQTMATGVYPNVRAGPVLVLFEDRSTSSRSLELGATLARRNGAELVLLIDAGSEDAYRAACTDARAALKARGTTGRCVRLSTLDGASLAKAVRRESAGCLVLANRERFLTQAGFERVLDAIECPIVLARQAENAVPQRHDPD